MKEKKTIEYRVPYADTDQMGVVYYANYLVYFERVRNELLRDTVASYKMMEASGVMLPVIEAVCNYKKPAVYDDLLELTAWVEGLKGPKVKICCVVCKDGVVLAEGYTVHACVSMKTRRPVRPPVNIVELSKD
jgi:acyl-CoA thioester hydrolase